MGVSSSGRETWKGKDLFAEEKKYDESHKA